MRAILAAFVLVAYQSLHAAPIKIDKSTSPNGEYFLAITPTPDEGDGTGTLEIRRTADSTVCGSFDWYQFGPIVNPKSATVLWRKDSRALALTWNMNRGWMGSEIYVLKSNKWFEIQPPFVRLNDKAVWKERGKGSYAALAWLSDGTLKMLHDAEAYRFDSYGQTILAQPLWVDLSFAMGTNPPSMKIVREEMEHPLKD